jgi:uncharacterized protein
MDQNEVFDFPCIFPLKVMGHQADDFEAYVVEIVQRHAPTSAYNTRQKVSSNGKYLSITVTFVAESRTQLDGIYQDLSHNPRVLMAL